ncbi:hypothetical protein HG536_0G00260 [Torulaspora globosa]|uniref:DUF1748-domain-containing protein n=1 Tax=Torulaspora globosa TaxID=48254 RepID=A0A7G3ZKY3_9SACH|nr:uncharacterized protein HG536_0G00260 [Torulaspora globosa]QLL34169.1 hypothetical protein HG536_0G00260 [Torulaspora globosa]
MNIHSLVHFGFDLTLVAMLLAALRQNTGYVFAFELTSGISQYVHRMLGWGEWCYSKFVNYAVGSQYFRKQLRSDGFTTRSAREIEELGRSSRSARNRRVE